LDLTENLLSQSGTLIQKINFALKIILIFVSCLPTLSGISLSPVLVTSTGFSGPILGLSSWLSGPVFGLTGGVVSLFAVPVLFALEVFVGISGNGVVLLVSGGFLFVFFLFFDFIWVSVEEEIWHDVPFFGSAEGSLQSLDFSGQKPVSQTNTVGGFVVARNADIDVFDWRIGIAQGNDWDVDVASFSDGLVVDSWIGDDDQSWLSVAGLGVIGKATWGESAVHGGSFDELGAFDGGSLTNIFGRNNADIFWVVDGGDDSGGEGDFFPHLGDVENMSTAGSSFPNVLVHLVVAVVASQMHFGGEDFPGIVGFEFKGADSVGHFGFWFFALFMVFLNKFRFGLNST